VPELRAIIFPMPSPVSFSRAPMVSAHMKPIWIGSGRAALVGVLREVGVLVRAVERR
jgi:hypothetical protein